MTEELVEAVPAELPGNLETMDRAGLIDLAKSLASLNGSLVETYNASARAHLELGESVGKAMGMWVDFLERLGAQCEDEPVAVYPRPTTNLDGIAVNPPEEDGPKRSTWIYS